MAHPPHLTLIDGSGFIFRAYHRLPPLTNPEGTPVGALFGFTSMLWNQIEAARKSPEDDYFAVVLDAGRIAQSGTPLELYETPANRFVAEFIGSPSINILDGEIDMDGRLRLGGGGTGLAVPAARAISPGPVKAGIRPEDMVASPDGPIRAKVRQVEHLGAETYVLFGQPGQQLCWRVPGTPPVAAGDDIRLSADPARIHLFDPDTGARL